MMKDIMMHSYIASHRHNYHINLHDSHEFSITVMSLDEERERQPLHRIKAQLTILSWQVDVCMALFSAHEILKAFI